MNKIKAMLMATVAAAVGYFVLQNFPALKEQLPSGLGGTQVSNQPRPDSFGPPVQRTGETIRIASFNIQVFGESKAQNVPVMDILCRIARNFDV